MRLPEKTDGIRPRVVCVDGFTMSVQASAFHYCSPRIDVDSGCDDIYTAVEIGYPSGKEDLLMPHAENAENPTGTVYGYVPMHVIDEVIAKHGGLKETA